LRYFVAGAFFFSIGTLALARLHSEWRKKYALAPRRPKLADGCHHVYVDVGSNIGVHSRFLFEPEKYPKATLALNIFNANFGSPIDRDGRDICVFAWEPNPAHAVRHQKLEVAYASLGWRYHYMPFGAGDQDGTLTFRHIGDEDKKEWGFSAARAPVKEGEDGGIEEKVPVKRLSAWLAQEIQGRLPPEKIHGVYGDGPGSEPTVVMKLDIEGSEFIVLPDLMFTGVLCETVDHIFGEFHLFDNKFFPMVFSPDEETGKGGLELINASWAGTYKKNLLRAFRSLRGSCRTTFDEGHSEIYLHDGQPLPGVNKIV